MRQGLTRKTGYLFVWCCICVAWCCTVYTNSYTSCRWVCSCTGRWLEMTEWNWWGSIYGTLRMQRHGTLHASVDHAKAWTPRTDLICIRQSLQPTTWSPACAPIFRLRSCCPL